MALWMGIILSPFVAFTVNGRVDDSNWTPAIVTAVSCLAGLLLIHVRAARSYRQLPPAVLAEYASGRVVPPLENVGGEKSTIEFGPRGPQTPLAGLTPNGIWFAPDAICGASWGRRLKLGDIDIKAGVAGARDLPTHAFEWDELFEWQVRDDTDGPDYYRLVLRDGDHVDLKRPIDPDGEPEILDYVRAVGGRPVRLLCDVT